MVVFTLVTDVEKVIRKLQAEHGEFALVMLYNGSLGAELGWNLIISARWLDRMSLAEGTRLIANTLNQTLGLENQRSVSRVTVLKTSEPFVRDMNNLYPVEFGSRLPIPQLAAGETLGSGLILFSQKAA
jgi:hypothetical protein